VTTSDHNKSGETARCENPHFAGAGAGAGVGGGVEGGVVGGGAVGAGADAGALAGIESSTDPPPPALEAISERISEVAMKIPADQAVRRDNSVAAPRAPKAV